MPHVLYGVVDLDEVEAFGYRQVPATGEMPVQDESEEFMSALIGDEANLVTLQTAEGEVLAVYDPDSCQAQVTAEVMPGWERAFELALALDAMVVEAAESAKNSDVVKAAWDDWSACMAAEGYNFAHPWAAFLWVWPGNEPGEEEIATATADVVCKGRDGVLERWSREMARLQLELLDENPGLLAEWLGIRLEWVDQLDDE